MGWLEKTDRIDARLLALYAERAELKAQHLPDEATRRLAELCARRIDVLEMMETERHRLEHATSTVRRAINSHIDYLRKQLKRIERDIDGAVRGRQAGRSCPAARRQWHQPRGAAHLWRPRATAQSAVHGHYGRDAAQSSSASLLRWLTRPGQTAQSGLGGDHAQAAADT
jgi:transposase